MPSMQTVAQRSELNPMQSAQTSHNNAQMRTLS